MTGFILKRALPPRAKIPLSFYSRAPCDARGMLPTAQFCSLRGSGGPRFRHILPTLIEGLLDVVGWPYDGIDHVVIDDVHETMLDPGKSDYPLAPVGVVAQTACDVVANLNLHRGLAEVEMAAVAKFKTHHILHVP